MANYALWKASVIGKGIDVDKAYGDQCVDVDLDWGEALFPGVAWQTLFPPVQNAKDLFATHNPKYFQAIENNKSDPNQLPIQGDIMVFDARPGYPAGHTGVCDSANSEGYELIMQDGTNPAGTTFEQYRPWNYRPCIGWLRAVVQPNNPPVPINTPGTKLFLPSSVQKWRVYRVAGPWTPGNEVAFVWPSLSPPGLTYDIMSRLAANIYQIKTQDFGVVAIYAGPDTDAKIS